MKKLISILLLIALCLSMLAGCDGDGGGENINQETEKLSYKTYNFSYFDTVTTIIGYESSSDEFKAVSNSIVSELAEYHKLFDIYNEYEGMVNLCTINKLYDGEHRQHTVDRRIIDMLLYAKKMYDVTDGKMNVAMGSVLSIWHDYRNAGLDNPKNATLPPMDLLTEAANHTNIDDLVIDEENCTVWIRDPKMTLDVGAIAKGYAVEMAARSLEATGKTGYVINVGGNIRTVGTKANGDKWRTGIENPTGDEEKPYVEYIDVVDKAVVTSGSYQRFYIVDGKSYHHIIDPVTLMPAIGFLSVSLICDNSADGDGLSTALFCMSLEDGMALVNSLDGVEALWVTENEEMFYSKNYKDFTVEIK